MGDTQRQREAFEFLRDHVCSQEPLTRDEFRVAIPEWKPESVDTYWLKRTKRLVKLAGNPDEGVEAARFAKGEWVWQPKAFPIKTLTV